MKAILFVLVLATIGCQEHVKLPYFTLEDGSKRVPSSFIGVNQVGDTVSQNDLLGKPYIVEFFYVNCPTICPVVKSRLVDIYEDDDFSKLNFVSFTLAPDFDTVAVLRDHADRLGISVDRWQLINVPFDKVYNLSHSYLVGAVKERNIDGEIDHDGRIILIDADGFMRAQCKATDDEDLMIFKEKVSRFLNE